jgi:CHAT domain-containing protein/Flp pilus assembly protein TadD
MPVSYKATLKFLVFVFSASITFASPRTTSDKSLSPDLQTSAQGDSKQLAEKTTAEGQALQAAGNADSFRKALAKYQTALAIWQTIDDRKGQAEVLDYIGTVHHFLDEKQQALEDFQQELKLWRVTEDRPKEAAEALNNSGVVYSSLGLSQKAIEAYQEALTLRRAAGDRAGVANTLDNIGLSYLDAGELQKALDHISQALALFRELNERPGIANTLNNIGGVYLTWGDYRKALEYFDEALELRRALGHHREEAIALNNIGRVYELLGEAQKALDYDQLALELGRKLQLRGIEATSINNIGIVYDWLGDRDKALEDYKQALDIFRATNNRNGEASSLNNVASFYVHTLNDPQTAIEYTRKALEIRRALGQRIAEANELDNLGFMQNKLGDARKAIEYHRQALEMRRALGHRPGEAASLTNLGAAHFALGELQPAFDYFNQALAMHRTMGRKSMEAISLYGLAQVESKRGNLDAARSRMEEALNIIESLRGKAATQDLRASFLAKKQDYYEFYIDLLLRTHTQEPAKRYDLVALQASERARSRSLLELLTEARIDVDQGIPPELKQRERITYSRIAFLQSRLVGAYSEPKPDQEKVKALEEEMKKVDVEREQLNMEIREKHPRYASLQYPAPLGLKEIQSLLDERTVLLEYALGKDTSFLFAVTSNDFLVARLPASTSIAQHVGALREAITVRPQRNALGKQINNSRELYRELIGPAEKVLSNKQKLIIVPSGILHYLPFEVLLSSGDEKTLPAANSSAWPYLLRRYAISYVQSAGVLASLRRRGDEAPPPKKTFLAFADPDYGNETAAEPGFVRARVRSAFGDQQSFKLQRLIESRREVEEIAKLHSRNQVDLFLGDQATEENVKATSLADYRYIHFATHGLLNENRPPYSGLILSLASEVSAPQGDAQKSPAAGAKPAENIRAELEDGLLQVYEVFSLKLNADLVVLSACETGLGKDVKGEGLVGLTNAFLYSGARSVLVSLWNVQDRSTADLMVNLYKEMGHDHDRGEALRQAKLKLIEGRRYSQPYYWAPFVLVGERR